MHRCCAVNQIIKWENENVSKSGWLVRNSKILRVFQCEAKDLFDSDSFSTLIKNCSRWQFFHTYNVYTELTSSFYLMWVVYSKVIGDTRLLGNKKHGQHDSLWLRSALLFRVFWTKFVFIWKSVPIALSFRMHSELNST